MKYLMRTDPREQNLPRWAQTVIDRTRQERDAALRREQILLGSGTGEERPYLYGPHSADMIQPQTARTRIES